MRDGGHTGASFSFLLFYSWTMTNGHGVGFALLCFGSLHWGAPARLWLYGFLSLSLSLLDSASYSLAIPDGFSGDGGAEGEELDMGYDMPLSSAVDVMVCFSFASLVVFRCALPMTTYAVGHYLAPRS